MYGVSCSRRSKAGWETDSNYCDGVRKKPPFDKGRVLLDLIDLHIFDFIQGRLQHNLTQQSTCTRYLQHFDAKH